jgi:hypothetical protein
LKALVALGKGLQAFGAGADGCGGQVGVRQQLQGVGMVEDVHGGPPKKVPPLA